MSRRIAIGLDIGGTYIKAGLVTDDGASLERWKRPTYASDGPDRLMKSLLSLTEDILKSDALSQWKRDGGSDPIGIGIGSPGTVNSTSGIVLSATGNLPGWGGTPVRDLFLKAFQLPVAIDNDANAYAWGEYCLGVGKSKPVQTLLVLTLGTGVGGGVVEHGRLIHGAHGAAGELGHIPLSESEDAPECNCGNRGCLEAFVCAPSMVRFAIDQSGFFPESGLCPLIREGKLTARHIHDTAREEDPLALKVIDRVARYLGIGLAGLVCCFDPDHIALGGGVSNLGDLLFPTVRRIVKERVFFSSISHLQIEPAQLGSEDGYLGAAALALFPQGN